MRKDFDFSFSPHPLTGDLPIKEDNRAIQQSLRNLVLTNFYERGFNTEVGSNMKSSLFENITPLVAQSLKEDIEEVIDNFEPNVELVDVAVRDNDNELLCTVYYTIFNNPEIQEVTIPIQRLR